jgi:hypothetical protein
LKTVCCFAALARNRAFWPRGGTEACRNSEETRAEQQRLITIVPPVYQVRDKAKVVGRWHDTRHTLVAELAESGAGDEVIMSIAGHVSRAMLSRYSHVLGAKRRALNEIAARQDAAHEKRKMEAERREQAAVASESEVVQ